MNLINNKCLNFLLGFLFAYIIPNLALAAEQFDWLDAKLRLLIKLTLIVSIILLSVFSIKGHKWMRDVGLTLFILTNFYLIIF